MCQALPPLDSGGERRLGCLKQSRFGRAVTSLGRRCYQTPHLAIRNPCSSASRSSSSSLASCLPSSVSKGSAACRHEQRETVAPSPQNAPPPRTERIAALFVSPFSTSSTRYGTLRRSDLRHDPARRRAGSRQQSLSRGEASTRPAARRARRGRHGGRLPGGVRG